MMNHSFVPDLCLIQVSHPSISILGNLEASQLPVSNSIVIPPEVKQQSPPEDLDKSLFPLWQTFEELIFTETQYVRQLGILILVCSFSHSIS